MTSKNSKPTDEQIVLTFQRDVWRFIVSLGCNPVEADDITQETFVKIILGGFEYRGDRELRSLLLMVAKRLFITTVRKRKRSPMVANLDDVDSDWIRFSEECDGDRRVDFMRECMQSIEGRSHRALMMKYRDQIDIGEIAESLELGEEGAKSLLRRLKHRLRECVLRKVASHG